MGRSVPNVNSLSDDILLGVKSIVQKFYRIIGNVLKFTFYRVRKHFRRLNNL